MSSRTKWHLLNLGAWGAIRSAIRHRSLRGVCREANPLGGLTYQSTLRALLGTGGASHYVSRPNRPDSTAHGRWVQSAGLAIGVLGLGVGGCEADFDTSVEGKLCSRVGRACLVGFVCSVEGVCLRPDGAYAQASEGDSSDVERDDDVVVQPSAVGGRVAGVAGSGGGVGRAPVSGAGARAAAGVGGARAVPRAGSSGAGSGAGGSGGVRAAGSGGGAAGGGSVEACAVGTSRCAEAAGSCVDLQAHVEHCGACGRACPGGDHAQPLCQAGQCQRSCDEGYSMCRDGCIDDDLVVKASLLGLLSLSTCEALDALTLLAGGIVCQEGRELCSGQCVDLQTDPHHCGACAAACEVATICSQGRCINAP
ncbi:MAG: hypothetical protein RL701_6488 [Pseudomonadota bacterium]